MATKTLPIDLIVEDPEIRGGRPVVGGTTIRVSDVVAYHLFDGQSPEELAVGFALDLSQVHAVLSYYHSHRAEIDAEIRANADEAERWRLELTRRESHRSVG